MFYIRQVPGDGGCLFHAIATWIFFALKNEHCDFDVNVRKLSNKLRVLSIEILQSNQSLVIENDETLNSLQLLDMVADNYNMNRTEYCTKMLDPKSWGGGPEIVALSNYFQCPIHVYQLSTSSALNLNFFTNKNNPFKLDLCAKFGSPAFDSKYPIQILCADGRLVIYL
jgi:hypothetical protein